MIREIRMYLIEYKTDLCLLGSLNLDNEKVRDNAENPPAMAAQNTKFLPLEAAAAPRPRLTSLNQVLINIRAVGLNPADHVMIAAGHRVASYPMTPGLDGPGIVKQIEDEVENVQVGDEIMDCFVTGDMGASFQT